MLWKRKLIYFWKDEWGCCRGLKQNVMSGWGQLILSLLSIQEFHGKWRDGWCGNSLKHIYLLLVYTTMSEDGGGGRSKFSWGFEEIGLSREPIFSYGTFIWIIWIWWTLTCSSDQGSIICWDWKKGVVWMKHYSWMPNMNNMGSKNYLSLYRKIGYGQLAWLHNSHCNVGLYCILPLATLILILMENNFLWKKNIL